MSPPGLTVAVTGPTGTFGSGLVPLLEDDERVTRVIGIAGSVAVGTRSARSIVISVSKSSADSNARYTLANRR